MQNKAKQKEKEKELFSVRGVVTPSEWDMRDEVTAVTIYAHDETEYLVNARHMVKRLMKHMDEEIEAHGFMGEDEYSNEVFIVSDFTPLDTTSDEEDEAEWEEDEIDEAEDDWEEEAADEEEPAEWDDEDAGEGETKRRKRR